MGIVKNIPIIGPMLAGPDVPSAPPPPPPVAEEAPVTAMPDPENEVAKRRKRRAAASQSGKVSTILSDGAGSKEKLGG